MTEQMPDLRWHPTLGLFVQIDGTLYTAKVEPYDNPCGNPALLDESAQLAPVSEDPRIRALTTELDRWEGNGMRWVRDHGLDWILDRFRAILDRTPAPEPPALGFRSGSEHLNDDAPARDDDNRVTCPSCGHGFWAYLTERETIDVADLFPEAARDEFQEYLDDAKKNPEFAAAFEEAQARDIPAEVEAKVAAANERRAEEGLSPIGLVIESDADRVTAVADALAADPEQFNENEEEVSDVQFRDPTDDERRAVRDSRLTRRSGLVGLVSGSPDLAERSADHDSNPAANVTRFEVIDQDGRRLVLNPVFNVSVSYQDDRRTLKVFLREGVPDGPAAQ
jgi:hypothetical protein